MTKFKFTSIKTALALTLFAIALPSYAGLVQVTVKAENLAPTNGVTLAPLRFGFNNGTFDAFNQGGTATAPIISIAENGSGSDWFPAFAAADPSAVLGTAGAAPILPGASAMSLSFLVDTAVNQFFTFAAMVVPSNDFFVGNDSPTAYRLFDNDGNLLISQIMQTAGDIWNAGSEAFDPANAAFIAGSNAALRTPENGVVGLNFSELAGFNGLTTAAGYTFDLGALTNSSNVLRISFTAENVPEPGVMGLMLSGILGLGFVTNRRLQAGEGKALVVA